MNSPVLLPDEADLERRFGGLRRLWGDKDYERLRRCHIGVVGIGGVGSWAAEALGRSGVRALTLIDLDHIAESNINRQVHALTPSIGQAKVSAMGDRLKVIHPGLVVHGIEAMVEPDHWPLPGALDVDVWIDACDDGVAKGLLAEWALSTSRPLVIVGAAGGKTRPQDVDVGDLVKVSHDPLLAGLRQRLRRSGHLPRGNVANGGALTNSGLRCVYSREAMRNMAEACTTDGSLNCHGYGSSVTVTATMGLVAASVAMQVVMNKV